MSVLSKGQSRIRVFTTQDVDGRHDQDALLETNPRQPAGLYLVQIIGQAGEDKDAVQFVAVQASDQGDGEALGGVPDLMEGDVEVFPAGSGHVQERGDRHVVSSIRRAISEPS